VTAGSFDVLQETEEGSNAPGVITPSRVPYAQDAVYMSLDPRDKFIFDARTGGHGQKVLSVTDVARRLGVSPAAISQRANSIAEMVKELSV
jgi:hypothetical protein